MSISDRGTLARMAEMWSSPIWGELQIHSVLLIDLISSSSLHSLELFYIVSMGMFHGLQKLLLCCSRSCSSTRCALSISFDRGHCGTQIASLKSQSRQEVLDLTVALRIGGELEEGFRLLEAPWV